MFCRRFRELHLELHLEFETFGDEQGQLKVIIELKHFLAQVVDLKVCVGKMAPKVSKPVVDADANAKAKAKAKAKAQPAYQPYPNAPTAPDAQHLVAILETEDFLQNVAGSSTDGLQAVIDHFDSLSINITEKKKIASKEIKKRESEAKAADRKEETKQKNKDEKEKEFESKNRIVTVRLLLLGEALTLRVSRFITVGELRREAIRLWNMHFPFRGIALMKSRIMDVKVKDVMISEHPRSKLYTHNIEDGDTLDAHIDLDIEMYPSDDDDEDN